jgi:hypothetical protein
MIGEEIVEGIENNNNNKMFKKYYFSINFIREMEIGYVSHVII